MRHSAIHDGVVVGESDRTVPRTADQLARGPQACAQRCVMINPGVFADSGVRTSIRTRDWRFGGREVRASSDDDGPCAVDGMRWIG